VLAVTAGVWIGSYTAYVLAESRAGGAAHRVLIARGGLGYARFTPAPDGSAQRLRVGLARNFEKAGLKGFKDTPYWPQSSSGQAWQGGPAAPHIRIPVWLPGMVLVALGFVCVLPDIHKGRRQGRGQCVHCGYDLRASKGRCPECGSPVG
jgi:hypothetical protein